MSKLTYRVSHVLVRQKYEAEDLLLKLKAGEKFEELARKFSICSSAENAGDLGIIKTGQADADFEEAALSLSYNEITRAPIRTRFGYHLIKRLK